MKRPIWILCLVSLGGCGSQPVTKPSEVTLVEAMKQVGTGLAEMRKAQGDLRTGLIAESVDVTFAIAAGSEQGSALKIDLAAPVVHEGATLGGEITGKSTSSRANTITIKFKNLLTVPKDTVGYAVVNSNLETQAAPTSDRPATAQGIDKAPRDKTPVHQEPGDGQVKCPPEPRWIPGGIDIFSVLVPPEC